MRVHELSPRSRRGEDGATAILAAVLAVVLVGLSAFTLDFGRAYVSKRALQNAADAASLAAAATYADREGTCDELKNGPNAPTYRSEARNDAISIVADARPGTTTLEDFTVDCLAGELTVDVTLNGSTPTVFGGVYGVSSITTQRTAQATVEVAPEVGRQLRPYAMCSQFIPDPVPSGVVKVTFPGAAGQSDACPTANNPGNWWTVNCPEDANNSNANLAARTEAGCSSPISIVEPQPPLEANATDNLDLTAALLAGCATAPQNDCLYADPGNINGSAVLDAWHNLVGKSIVLPVFCGEPYCDPAAVVPDGGNNVRYPVHRFVAVTVCGYHWGATPPANLQHISTTGDCAGNTEEVTSGGNSQNYLLLRFTQIQVTGSTADGSCPLGDPTCDGGARQTRLTR